MQVGKINNSFRINFSQNQNQIENNKVQNTETSYTLPYLTSIPAGFVNVNPPIKYTKINEFILPDNTTKVHIYKLANGQTIVLAPKKGETQINTYVNCGSMNETDDIRGISHYIEHNLFNGSKNINPKEFFNSVNKIGAYTNAWTSEHTTSYLIQSNLFDSEDLKKIIELHADMVQYPKFEQAQLDKEKGVVNSEITMYDDDNYRIMTGKAFKQLFRIDSTANDIVGGTVSNINNLKREDVVNYYNKNYTPDRMMTILTGEFNPDEAIDLISKSFTKPAAVKNHQYYVDLKPIEHSKRIDYVSSNINSDEFIMGFAGPENNNLKDNIAISIITHILSGKSYSKLSQSLKPYNVEPHIISNKASNKLNCPQYIELGGRCKSEDTENVLKTIFSTIHNSKYQDLNEDIEIAKKDMLRAIQSAFETGNTINSFLYMYLTDFTPSQIQQIPDIIKGITADDIKNALGKYFDLNKVSLVVAHPKTKLNEVSFKRKLEKKGLDLNEFKYAQLKNNGQIYIKDSKSDLKDFVLSMKCDIPANVTRETYQLLTKILNKGAISQTEADFEKDLSKHSGTVYFAAGPNGISAGGNSLNEDINYALNKVIEVLNNPKFDQTYFDEAKSQIEKEIIEEKKSPACFINEIMYPQLKSSSTKEQKLEALKNIKLEDIRGLMKYIKENSSLYFGWSRNEIPYILNNLGDFKPVRKQAFLTYSPLQKNVLKVQSEESGQAKVIQVYKFEQSNNPQEIAKLKVLNSILGGQTSSRLFTDLRETQKLAYSTGSNIETFGNTGLIMLHIGTTTDNPQDSNATSANITKSLNGFKRNINKIKTQLVSDEELQTAKLKLKSDILNRTETNANCIAGLIDNVSSEKDPDYSNKVMKAIDDVTAEDVLKTAQKVFEGNSLTSIVASKKTLKELNLQH